MGAMESIKIEIPRAVIADIIMERIGGRLEVAATASQQSGPQIGEAYEGGRYAGLTISDNVPQRLVLLPDEAENVNWKDACDWAKEQGGELPSRFDQLVLFNNLKSEFQDTWYWSGTQYAPDPDYAWFQDFADGGQCYGSKHGQFRARAVRRIPIE